MWQNFSLHLLKSKSFSYKFFKHFWKMKLYHVSEQYVPFPMGLVSLLNSINYLRSPLSNDTSLFFLHNRVTILTFLCEQI